MAITFENDRRLVADLEHRQSSESLQAAKMVRDYYSALGARAIVLMDKDDTVIHMEVGQSTDPQLEGVIENAQRKGIICSYDSDSSYADLVGELGMTGLPIAERGGLIRFPTGAEIHLVQSGSWFMNLNRRFIDRINKDPELNEQIEIREMDPWPFLFSGKKLDAPGKKRLVMINSGRHVSAGFVSAVLDSEGNVIRHTQESQAFYQQMAEIFKQERDKWKNESPFPDPEGIIDDLNDASELVIFKSATASKQRAMRWLVEVLSPLGVKIYHIGDSRSDDMTFIPGVITMAVGNGELKDIPNVVASPYERATGVVDLFENHIFKDLSI